MRSLLAFGTLAAALALGVACTVHQATAPTLTGPSQFATAVSITATPDSISQDGASQASIVVLAFDASGKPLPGLAIRLDMQVGGVTQDFGTLSAKSIVTGNDGKALSVYTAPPSSPAPSTNSGTPVSIRATVTGTNAETAQSQSVTIRLVPPGVILPPAVTPTPKFSFSPTSPAAKLPTLFDASASCAGSSACSSTAGITNFVWNFGDGTFGSGVQPSHTFQLNGTFNVTLTVTNSGGTQASTSQAISVGTGNAPTVDFVFSPSAPTVNQTINFDASQARAGNGHTIASYGWNFGDGSSAGGVTTTHAFAAVGTFNTTLTVTDESGQATTVTKAVSVVAGGSGGGGGVASASFTFSPAQPVVNQLVVFNASSSTAVPGHTITSYSWDFGDLGTSTGPTATATHTYTTALTFQVTLTTTDDGGNTAKFVAPVIVSSGSSIGLTANFTMSPTNPSVNQQVVFNASTSSTTPGLTITEYDWNFGDGTSVIATPSATISHSFATANTFTINLTVKDSGGRSATATPQTITVTGAVLPAANFTFSPAVGTHGVAMSFDASSSTGTIASYTWNWGDGSALETHATSGATHTYATAGTYSVTLTVTDTAGRTSTISKTFTVQ